MLYFSVFEVSEADLTRDIRESVRAVLTNEITDFRRT